MRQAVMVEPGQIQFRDVPEPTCEPDQVVVRVRRIGVCGSDMHVWHGTHPFTGYPVVQGHEFAGEIIEVGTAVRDGELTVGRKVTCEIQLTCGQCKPCRAGRYHICEHLRVMGFQAPGVAQETVALPAEKIIPLPDRFTFDEGALMEPAAVGVHATQRGHVEPGDAVVIVGAGPIGMMVALAAKARGAARIVISEPSATRRAFAQHLDVGHVIDPNTQPLAEEVGRHMPDGPDVIIECVGSEASVTAALDAVGKGVRIVAVGVYPQRPRIDMARVVEWELDLIGSMMYRRDDWLTAVRWVDQGAMAVAQLVTRHVPFEQYAEAYRWLDAHPGEAVKVMIDVGA